jgi:hypothetical protein
MINFFDVIFNFLNRKYNCRIFSIFFKIIRFIFVIFVNKFLNYYFLLFTNNERFKLCLTEKSSNRIIVSLTTIPSRINRLWLVIETLLRQTHKPDKIILWLSIDQFPNLSFLPNSILKQVSRGLEIRFVSNNLRSHKKYFYAFKEFKNDYIITVDDDIFYKPSLIKNLVTNHLKYPNAIIANYCKIINYNVSILEPYKTWKINIIDTKPNYTLFFGTGGGVFFPINCFNDLVLNSDLFLTLTPTADDIWLNAMCRFNKTSIVGTKDFSFNLPVIHRKNTTLHKINNIYNQNDQQIDNINKYFLHNYNIKIF